MLLRMYSSHLDNISAAFDRSYEKAGLSEIFFLVESMGFGMRGHSECL